jgi:murein DD-endopeptidase MepM/ murein hydrolase activator NlpD
VTNLTYARPRRAAALGAICLLGALVAPVGPPAHAEPPRERRRQVQREMKEQQEDVHESTAAVRRAAVALRKAEAALPGARAKLAAARGQLAAARAAATRAAAEVDVAKQAAEIARKGLEQANVELQANHDAIEDMARSTYMTGGMGAINVILEATTVSEMVDRQVYVQHAMRNQNAAIHGASAARAKIASQTARLEARLQEVERRQKAADAAVKHVVKVAQAAAAAEAEVRAQVAARGRALAVAERHRSAEAAHYLRLRQESARLAALIRKIEQQRRAAARRAARAGRRSSGPRDNGSGLSWPTSGPLTSSFGYRMHPIYHYRRLHAGIDIGAPWGQSVHAAAGGVVTFAGGMGGYGNMVLVSHGGLTTGYAHLSAITVRRGAHVSRGSVVGRIGSTGSSTGPHLHFETRVNGSPVNPMRYF